MAGNDHNAPKWYFTRKEIEDNSLSRRDGIDLKKEAYLRKSYCTFLQDLGMRLKVPQVTIATAIIFCHRFFLHQSHAKNARKTVATVCMFLAGKVEETPRPLKDVILVSYEIIHRRDPAAIQKIKQKEVYEQQKELILLGERMVLTTLGFDLNVHHPYKPLVEAIKKFKVAQNALAQVAWNFVNDGLRTSLCLQFKPHHIAAGAIFLAAKFLKVKLPTEGEKVWWQEFDVTPRQLEDVSNQMLELYEQNRPGQSSLANEGSTFGGPNQPVATTSTISENSVAPNTTQEVGIVNARLAAQAPPTSRSTGGQFDTDSNRLGPQSSQNQSNDNGSADTKSGVWDQSMDIEGKDCLHHEVGPISFGRENTAEYLSSSKFSAEQSSGDAIINDKGEKVVVTEWKDEGSLPMTSSAGGRCSRHGEAAKDHCPPDAMAKFDREKVKAALEKRRRFRNDAAKKSVIMDEDDLIERELENGIELTVEDEKLKQERRHVRSKPLNRQEAENHCFEQAGAQDKGNFRVSERQSSHGRIKYQSIDSEDRIIPDHCFEADLENAEEGELSSLDEHEFPSPKLSFDKGKAMNSRKWPDHSEKNLKRHRFERHG